MNCPGHFLRYAQRGAQLSRPADPLHEQTPLHRNEASGVLSDLTRVRQFSQDDAHCFVMPDQIGDEVERLMRLVQRVYGDFGLPFTAKLSTAARRVHSARWRPGIMPRRSSRRRSSARGMAYTLNERRRRVLRAEDRLRRHRRDRPEVAVRHDPARLHAAAELRLEIHRRRQRRAPAGRHPPGDFRQFRAVHRAC